MSQVEDEIARLTSEDGYHIVTRTQRIYLDIDEHGEAVLRLHPPHEDD